jgi:hypothetical protein
MKPTTEAEAMARLKELRANGRKGGLANMANHPPEYPSELGRLGGLAKSRRHGAEAQAIRKRLAGE